MDEPLDTRKDTEINEPAVPISEIEALIREMDSSRSIDPLVNHNRWKENVEQLIEDAKEGFTPENENLEVLKDRLEEQAKEDRLNIDLMLRNRDLKIGCSDLNNKGLQLWLESYGAEVHRKDNEDGRFIVAPKPDTTDTIKQDHE